MSKEPRKIFDLRFSILVGLELFLVVLLSFQVVSGYRSGSETTGGPGAGRFRELGARLKGVGLSGEAAAAWERAFALTPSGSESAARLAYGIAQLYEEAGNKEKALSWYYAAQLDGAPQDLKGEIARREVALLESMNKVAAAKQALKEGTSLQPAAGPAKGGQPVARIGGREIFAGDVDAATDQLDPEARRELIKPEFREKFLRSYVAEEVLRQKAERLGVADKAEFKRRLEAVRRQLLVAKVIEEEVMAKISIDEIDLKNYFEANKAKFVTREAPKPDFKSARQAVELSLRREKGQVQYQKVLDDAMSHEEVKLFPENWR
jgi:tetratricopeptide (TPR) repeat protein